MEYNKILNYSLEVIMDSDIDIITKKLIVYLFTIKKIEKKLNDKLGSVIQMEPEEFASFKELTNKHKNLKSMIEYNLNLVDNKLFNKCNNVNDYVSAVIINYINKTKDLSYFFTKLNEKLGNNVFLTDQSYMKTDNLEHERVDWKAEDKNINYQLKKYFAMVELFNISICQTKNISVLFYLNSEIINCNEKTYQYKQGNLLYDRKKINHPDVFDLYLNIKEENKYIFEDILSNYFYNRTNCIYNSGPNYAIFQLIQRLQEEELFNKIASENFFINLDLYIEKVYEIPGIMNFFPTFDVYRKINKLIDQIKSGKIKLQDNYNK